MEAADIVDCAPHDQRSDTMNGWTAMEQTLWRLAKRLVMFLAIKIETRQNIYGPTIGYIASMMDWTCSPLSTMR